MSAPDSVHDLAKARLAARAEKNFALSDQLRDQIANQGFEVVDVAGGYELRPKKRFPTYESTRDIRPINSGKYEITVAMIIDGFQEDAVTTIKTIKEHSQCAIAILVVGEPGVLVDELDARTSLVQLTEDFGWDEEVFLSFLPLSHAYEHSGGQHFPVGLGAQIYYSEGIDKLASNIEEVRPTLMVVVPRLFEVLRARILKQMEKQGKVVQLLLNRALSLGAKDLAGGMPIWDRPMNALLNRTLRPKIQQRFGGRMRPWSLAGHR